MILKIKRGLANYLLIIFPTYLTINDKKNFNAKLIKFLHKGIIILAIFSPQSSIS